MGREPGVLKLDPEDILAALTDHLLETGDLSDALERLLRGGFETPDGERIDGLREMLEQTRERREELLSRGDPDGELARLTASASTRSRTLERAGHRRAERRGSSLRRRAAPPGGHQRRGGRTLDGLYLMPNDIAGKVRSMQAYEFVSSEAREAFEATGRRDAPGGHRRLLPRHLRGAQEPRSRIDGSDARRHGCPQPDARAAQPRGGPRSDLRSVHGAVRRPLPREQSRSTSS